MNLELAGRIGAISLLFLLVINFPGFAQPSNDNPGSAVGLTLNSACSTGGTYTNVGGTADHTAGACWSSGPTKNVWFSFTASATKFVNVQIKVSGAGETMRYPEVAIWDASFSPVACQNQVGSATDLSLSYYGLTATNTYYISVDTWSAGTYGKFDICISDVADYDYPQGAAPLTSTTCTSAGTYSNLLATADNSGGSCWSSAAYKNRWFTFTATTNFINVQVKVSGASESMRYPEVAIWNSSLTQIACQNQVGSATDLSLSYFGLTATNTYYISVDNWSAGTAGSFDICLTDVVDYDYPQGAKSITSTTCTSAGTYSNLLATADNSGGSCWSSAAYKNRWFTFTATTNFINVQVKVSGASESMRYPEVAIWNSSLTQIACQNQVGSATDLSLSYFGLTATNTYYISVDNWSAGTAGSFDICLTDVVDYDYPQGAKSITSTTCTSTGTYSNLLATADNSGGSCWSSAAYKNRWFTFTATTNFINVQVKVSGASESMRYPEVAIWNSSLTQIACQNQVGSATDLSLSYFGLTATNTYYISVDNWSAGTAGSFDICLTDVVDYDYPQGAKSITSTTCTSAGTYSNLLATADNSGGSCWSSAAYKNRWFTFTATTNFINVQVKVSGASESMRYPEVAIWNSSLTQIACQNQVGSATDLSLSYFGLTATNTYYISVDNWSAGTAGSFDICLTDVVDYDYPQGAKSITSTTCTSAGTYSNLLATADNSGGSCWSSAAYKNRWFTFTATTNFINVQVKVSGASESMRYPEVAIWNSSLTQIACQNQVGSATDLSLSYFGLTATNTYYISVDNWSAGTAGSFDICLTDVVDYDYPQGAINLTSTINGCTSAGTYSNLLATADNSGGSCWSSAAYKNRWFTFTATTNFINVQVKVSGASESMRYPEVAIWNSSLTQIVCQNQIGSTIDLSLSYYGLTIGSAYYISVDNWSAGTPGSFDLCLTDVVDYDFPQGAVVLTDLNNYCSSGGAYSNQLATADHAKGSCWSDGPNKNRWFTFTALTNTATIQVKVSTNTMKYPELALWTSGFSQLACKNQAGAAVDISLTYSTLTVGSTYYISVDTWSAGTYGTFDVCITNVYGTQYYSIGDGDWNTTAVWSNIGFGSAIQAATPPIAGSVVNIRDHAISVASGYTASCAEVDLTVSGAATSLTIDNNTLIVSGKYAVSNATNFSCTTTVQNSGVLSVANNFSVNRSGGTASTQLVVTSGNVSVGQDMSWTSSVGSISNSGLTLSNTSTLSVSRDVNLTYSGGQKISLNFNNTSALAVGRDLTFTSTAAAETEAIFNNSSGMSIKRNIVRGGTPYGMLTFNNTSTLTFNGTANQQIIPASAGSGGDAITYNNVVLNNISGFALDFTFGGVATIPGTLTPNQGIAQSTSTNYFALLNSSSSSLGSTSSYIDGPMNYEVATSTPNTVRNFPIGNNGSYRPLVLTVSHTNSSSIIYTAQHFTSSAAALGYTLDPATDRVSGVRYWTLGSSDLSNLSSASVTLYYGYGSTDGVTDLPNLTVVKTLGAGTAWVNINKVSATAEPGNVVSGSFNTSFGKFTLANLTGGGNPLPIELLSFDGRTVSDGVALTWVTASEHNNDYFEVQKSSNGSEFQTFIRVKGAGTKNTLSHYAVTDMNPSTGLNYYLLKQVDFDGRISFSEIILIRSETEDAVAFPNPTNGTSIKIRSSLIGTESTIEIINNIGVSVYSKLWSDLPTVNQITTVEGSENLTSGLYFLRISGDGKSQTFKIIISK